MTSADINNISAAIAHPSADGILLDSQFAYSTHNLTASEYKIYILVQSQPHLTNTTIVSQHNATLYQHGQAEG